VESGLPQWLKPDDLWWRVSARLRAVPFPVKVKTRVRVKIEIKVKGDGQECPSYTGP
jgi:hypothetical protein